MRRWENFEGLYREHYVLLSLVAFSILKDKEAAKDVVHDFFLAFWKKRDQIVVNTSFKSYASKAVKNMSLQYLEKLKKDAKHREKIHRLQIENALFPDNFLKKKGAKIMDLLGQLPESRKNIFLDHVVNGLTYREIAEANNISINTVKTQMKRAYSFLREESS